MAISAICSVEGCGKPLHCRGYCVMHYRRLMRRGDPLVTISGQIAAWIENAVNFDGNECLIWPFARAGTGYGNLKTKNGNRGAHRVICELAHGAPPHADMHAAHNCGNGHLGCVNPRHLEWKTKAENEQDKFLHGRISRGVDRPNSKLTEEDVRGIRRLGYSVPLREIATRYGISRSLASQVIRREIWTWLP